LAFWTAAVVTQVTATGRDIAQLTQAGSFWDSPYRTSENKFAIPSGPETEGIPQVTDNAGIPVSLRQTRFPSAGRFRKLSGEAAWDCAGGLDEKLHRVVAIKVMTTGQ
jgi:hypothetical protein